MKIITVTTLLIFLSTNIVWPLPDASIFALSPKSQTLQLPESYGRVTESFQGTSSFTINHIQDAHSHYEAQQNIRNILKTLTEKNGNTFIGLEGANTQLAPKSYHFFPWDFINLKIADSLMKKGSLSGAEYFALELEENNSPLRKKLIFEGVESVDIYKEDLELFKTLILQKNEVQQTTKQLDSALDKIQSKVYNSDLLKLTRKKRAYQNKEIDLMIFLSAIQKEWQKTFNLDLSSPLNQKAWPYLSRMLYLKQQESNISLQAVKREVKDLIQVLNQKIGDAQVRSDLIQNLEAMTSASRKSEALIHKNPRAFFEALYQASLERSFSLEPYTHLRQYAETLILQSEVSGQPFFEELDRSFEMLQVELTNTEEEKSLIQLSKSVELLGQLLNLEASSEEWTLIQKAPQSYSPKEFSEKLGMKSQALDDSEKLFQQAMQFYELAEKRDRSLVQNTLTQMKQQKKEGAILVTGGFHTQGMTELLRQQNITYNVIQPHMETGLDDSVYEKAITGTWETLFDRAKIQKVLGMVSTLDEIQTLGGNPPRHTEELLDGIVDNLNLVIEQLIKEDPELKNNLEALVYRIKETLEANPQFKEAGIEINFIPALSDMPGKSGILFEIGLNNKRIVVPIGEALLIKSGIQIDKTKVRTVDPVEAQSLGAREIYEAFSQGYELALPSWEELKKTYPTLVWILERKRDALEAMIVYKENKKEIELKEIEELFEKIERIDRVGAFRPLINLGEGVKAGKLPEKVLDMELLKRITKASGGETFSAFISLKYLGKGVKAGRLSEEILNAEFFERIVKASIRAFVVNAVRDAFSFLNKLAEGVEAGKVKKEVLVVELFERIGRASGEKAPFTFRALKELATNVIEGKVPEKVLDVELLIRIVETSKEDAVENINAIRILGVMVKERQLPKEVLDVELLTNIAKVSKGARLVDSFNSLRHLGRGVMEGKVKKEVVDVEFLVEIAESMKEKTAEAFEILENLGAIEIKGEFRKEEVLEIVRRVGEIGPKKVLEQLEQLREEWVGQTDKEVEGKPQEGEWLRSEAQSLGGDQELRKQASLYLFRQEARVREQYEEFREERDLSLPSWDELNEDYPRLVKILKEKPRAIEAMMSYLGRGKKGIRLEEIESLFEGIVKFTGKKSNEAFSNLRQLGESDREGRLNEILLDGKFLTRMAEVSRENSWSAFSNLRELGESDREGRLNEILLDGEFLTRMAEVSGKFSFHAIGNLRELGEGVREGKLKEEVLSVEFLERITQASGKKGAWQTLEMLGELGKGVRKGKLKEEVMDVEFLVEIAERMKEKTAEAYEKIMFGLGEVEIKGEFRKEEVLEIVRRADEIGPEKVLEQLEQLKEEWERASQDAGTTEVAPEDEWLRVEAQSLGARDAYESLREAEGLSLPSWEDLERKHPKLARILKEGVSRIEAFEEYLANKKSGFRLDETEKLFERISNASVTFPLLNAHGGYTWLAFEALRDLGRGVSAGEVSSEVLNAELLGRITEMSGNLTPSTFEGLSDLGRGVREGKVSPEVLNVEFFERIAAASGRDIWSAFHALRELGEGVREGKVSPEVLNVELFEGIANASGEAKGSAFHALVELGRGVREGKVSPEVLNVELFERIAKAGGDYLMDAFDSLSGLGRGVRAGEVSSEVLDVELLGRIAEVSGESTDYAFEVLGELGRRVKAGEVSSEVLNVELFERIANARGEDSANAFRALRELGRWVRAGQMSSEVLDVELLGRIAEVSGESTVNAFEVLGELGRGVKAGEVSSEVLNVELFERIANARGEDSANAFRALRKLGRGVREGKVSSEVLNVELLGRIAEVSGESTVNALEVLGELGSGVRAGKVKEEVLNKELLMKVAENMQEKTNEALNKLESLGDVKIKSEFRKDEVLEIVRRAEEIGPEKVFEQLNQLEAEWRRQFQESSTQESSEDEWLRAEAHSLGAEEEIRRQLEGGDRYLFRKAGEARDGELERAGRTQLVSEFLREARNGRLIAPPEREITDEELLAIKDVFFGTYWPTKETMSYQEATRAAEWMEKINKKRAEWYGLEFIEEALAIEEDVRDVIWLHEDFFFFHDEQDLLKILNLKTNKFLPLEGAKVPESVDVGIRMMEIRFNDSVGSRTIIDLVTNEQYLLNQVANVMSISPNGKNAWVRVWDSPVTNSTQRLFASSHYEIRDIKTQKISKWTPVGTVVSKVSEDLKRAVIQRPGEDFWVAIDLEFGKEVRLEDVADPGEMSKDGKIMKARFKDETIGVINLETGKVVVVGGALSDVVSLSLTGRYVEVEDQMVDTETGKAIELEDGQRASRMSPNDKWISVRLPNGMAGVVNRVTKQNVTPEGVTRIVEYSSDSQWVVMEFRDKRREVLNLETGEIVKPKRPAKEISFSKNNLKVKLIYQDTATVGFIDLKTKEELSLEEIKEYRSGSLTRDGSRMAYTKDKKPYIGYFKLKEKYRDPRYSNLVYLPKSEQPQKPKKKKPEPSLWNQFKSWARRFSSQGSSLGSKTQSEEALTDEVQTEARSLGARETYEELRQAQWKRMPNWEELERKYPKLVKVLKEKENAIEAMMSYAGAKKREGLLEEIEDLIINLADANGWYSKYAFEVLSELGDGVRDGRFNKKVLDVELLKRIALASGESSGPAFRALRELGEGVREGKVNEDLLDVEFFERIAEASGEMSWSAFDYLRALGERVREGKVNEEVLDAELLIEIAKEMKEKTQRAFHILSDLGGIKTEGKFSKTEVLEILRRTEVIGIEKVLEQLEQLKEEWLRDAQDSLTTEAPQEGEWLRSEAKSLGAKEEYGNFRRESKLSLPRWTALERKYPKLAGILLTEEQAFIAFKVYIGKRKKESFSEKATKFLESVREKGFASTWSEYTRQKERQPTLEEIEKLFEEIEEFRGDVAENIFYALARIGREVREGKVAEEALDIELLIRIIDTSKKVSMSTISALRVLGRGVKEGKVAKEVLDKERLTRIVTASGGNSSFAIEALAELGRGVKEGKVAKEKLNAEFYEKLAKLTGESSFTAFEFLTELGIGVREGKLEEEFLDIEYFETIVSARGENLGDVFERISFLAKRVKEGRLVKELLDVELLATIAEASGENHWRSFSALETLADEIGTEERVVKELLGLEFLTTIAEASGENTGGAFYALAELARLERKEKVKEELLDAKYLIRIAKASGSGSGDAFETLSELAEGVNEGRVSEELLKAKFFERIAKASMVFSSTAFSELKILVSEVRGGRVNKEVIEPNFLLEIVETMKGYTAEIFTLLRSLGSREMRGSFGKEEVIEIVRKADKIGVENTIEQLEQLKEIWESGKSEGEAELKEVPEEEEWLRSEAQSLGAKQRYEAFRKSEDLELPSWEALGRDYSRLTEILKSVENAVEAMTAYMGATQKEIRLGDVETFFVRIAEAGGEDSWKAFLFLRELGEGVRSGKVREEVLDVEFLTRIAEASGEDSYQAFHSLRKLGEGVRSGKVREEVLDVEFLTRIAEASGEDSGHAFKALRKLGEGVRSGKVREEVLDVEFLTRIAEASGEDSSGTFSALHMLGHDVITGRVREEVLDVELLTGIAEASGESSGTAFYALSKLGVRVKLGEVREEVLKADFLMGIAEKMEGKTGEAFEKIIGLGDKSIEGEFRKEEVLEIVRSADTIGLEKVLEQLEQLKEMWLREGEEGSSDTEAVPEGEWLRAEAQSLGAQLNSQSNDREKRGAERFGQLGMEGGLGIVRAVQGMIKAERTADEIAEYIFSESVGWDREEIKILLEGLTRTSFDPAYLSEDARGKFLEFLENNLFIKGISNAFSVSFSDDGTEIIEVGTRSNAKAWNIETGEYTREFQKQTNVQRIFQPWIKSKFLPDYQMNIISQKGWFGRKDDQSSRRGWFSTDGKKFLPIGETSVPLLDVETGETLQIFNGHENDVLTLMMSEDQKRLLTGGTDLTARLWDVETGEELQVFQGHGNSVMSVAMSLDGKTILTGGADDTARLWNADTGEELHLLRGHNGSVGAVALSPDGKLALTGSRESIRLWDVETGEELQVFRGAESAVTRLAFNSDSSKFLAEELFKKVRVWDLDLILNNKKYLQWETQLKNEVAVIVEAQSLGEQSSMHHKGARQADVHEPQGFMASSPQTSEKGMSSPNVLVGDPVEASSLGTAEKYEAFRQAQGVELPSWEDLERGYPKLANTLESKEGAVEAFVVFFEEKQNPIVRLLLWIVTPFIWLIEKMAEGMFKKELEIAPFRSKDKKRRVDLGKIEELFERIAEASGRGSGAAFRALRELGEGVREGRVREEVLNAELFERIAEAGGEYPWSAFIALRELGEGVRKGKVKEEVLGVELFERIAKASGEHSLEAFRALRELGKGVRKGKVKEEMLGVELFERIAEAGGEYPWSAFIALRELGEGVRKGKVKEEMLGVELFERIAEASGRGSGAAFRALRELGEGVREGRVKEEVLEVELLTRIAEASGVDSSHAFRGLRELGEGVKVGKVGKEVLRAELLGRIAEVSGEHSLEAFRALRKLGEGVKQRGVGEEVLEVEFFEKIAEASGESSWSAFSALRELGEGVKQRRVGEEVLEVELFEKIAEASGEGSEFAFEALVELGRGVRAGEVSSEVLKVELLGRIAEVSGGSSGYVFEILGALGRGVRAGEVSSEVLDEELLIGIAEVSGEHMWSAFRALRELGAALNDGKVNEGLLEVDLFEKIAEASGKKSFSAFEALHKLVYAVRDGKVGSWVLDKEFLIEVVEQMKAEAGTAFEEIRDLGSAEIGGEFRKEEVLAIVRKVDDIGADKVLEQLDQLKKEWERESQDAGTTEVAPEGEWLRAEAQSLGVKEDFLVGFSTTFTRFLPLALVTNAAYQNFYNRVMARLFPEAYAGEVETELKRAYQESVSRDGNATLAAYKSSYDGFSVTIKTSDTFSPEAEELLLTLNPRAVSFVLYYGDEEEAKQVRSRIAALQDENGKRIGNRIQVISVVPGEETEVVRSLLMGKRYSREILPLAKKLYEKPKQFSPSVIHPRTTLMLPGSLIGQLDTVARAQLLEVPEVEKIEEMKVSQEMFSIFTAPHGHLLGLVEGDINNPLIKSLRENLKQERGKFVFNLSSLRQKLAELQNAFKAYQQILTAA